MKDKNFIESPLGQVLCNEVAYKLITHIDYIMMEQIRNHFETEKSLSKKDYKQYIKLVPEYMDALAKKHHEENEQ